MTHFSPGVDAASQTGFNIGIYDYIAATYPSGTQTVYKFYVGGSGGTLIATITINYTDSTQNFILNVTKS